MIFQYSVYVLPLIAAAAISGYVAAYSWTRRQASGGAIALSLLSLAVAIWALAYALEIAGADLPTKLFWGQCEYFGIATMPILWLIFNLNYANQFRTVSYRSMLLLAVLPAITIVLVFTNASHRLIWTDYFVQQYQGFSVLSVSHGPAFWLYLAYSYVCLLAGTLVLLRSMGRIQGLYRGQVIALLLAVLAPWFGNALYLSGLTPFPGLDLTPFAFTITSAALSWGIFGFRLMDLSPLARDLVVEEMQDAMFVLDGQGRVVDINPSAQRLIGVTAAQAIGRQAAEALSAWPQIIARYQDVKDYEDEIIVGEGAARRWYELHIFPIVDRQGRLIGRTITLRDVTQRKQSVERIDQLAREQKIILDNIPVGVAFLSDSATVWANNLFTSLLGYTMDELPALQTLFEPAETGDPGRTIEQINARLARGETVTEELKLRRKDGGRSWFNLVGQAIDAQQAGAGVLWVAQDISEQRQAREQVRRQNEVLSILHQVTLELLNRRELSDLLPLVVNRACSLLDASFGEILLKDGDDLVIHAYTQEQAYLAGQRVRRGEGQLSWQAFDTRQPVSLEDYAAWPARMPLYDAIDLHAVVVFPVLIGEQCSGTLELGRSRAGYAFTPEQVQMGVLFARLVALVLDNASLYDSALNEIAERKRAEIALEAARDHALEASQFKSRLLAKVSHELRTPLGGILGYAELLQDEIFGELNEKQMNAAANIMDSGQYLNIMINELLDQAQIESKTIKLFKEHFILPTLLKKVEASMGVLARAKGLKFTTFVSPGLPAQLYGDAQRLQQILINLISNAIKFTTVGEVSVTLFAPDEAHWAIQINDTGAGIPDDAQGYIFEAFRQVDNSITRENRGTGLGLSITEQLVKMMGGTISLHSVIGLGSTFTVTLPLEIPPKNGG